MKLQLDQGQKQSQKQAQILSQVQRQSLSILEMSNRRLEEFLREHEMENPLMRLKIDREKNSQVICREEDTRPEIAAYEGQTLEQYLWEQLEENSCTRTEEKRLRYIFSMVDVQTGYLQMTEVELADVMGCSIEEIREYLQILWSLEPAGVGAANLQESLILQAKRMGKLDETLRQILQEDLEDVARQAFGTICRKRKITQQKLTEYLEIIRSLNPRLLQGIPIRQSEAVYQIPDLVARRGEEGWLVELCNERNLKIDIEDCYESILAVNTDAQVISYLKEKRENINFLRAAMEKRKSTLLKMTKLLLDYQDNWLTRGGARKGIRMEEVADELGVAVSTISRAVKDKSVELPDRQIALKDFFTASESKVHQRILQIIAEEDKRRPYSDAQLAKFLGKEGITISRRTVMKYREELMIANSTQRKNNTAKR